MKSKIMWINELWKERADERSFHKKDRFAGLCYMKLFIFFWFSQGTCSKCLKSGFKTPQSFREHMSRCEFCTNCQCYRSKTHIRTCNVEPENQSRCDICNKWMQKANIPRHLWLHQQQLDEKQVNIINYTRVKLWMSMLLSYLFVAIMLCSCRLLSISNCKGIVFFLFGL